MGKVIGIDIGNYSIKLIELEDKKGHLELVRFAVKRLADGDIKSTLKNLLSLTKSPLRRANISLSGTSVIVRYIEMPAMKKEELQSAIKFEAEKYIPFDIDNSIIDCAMLDKAGTGAQRILLVAAKKSVVNNLLELFKDIGIEINAIDVDSFAFLNSFQRLNLEAAKENPYALLNMGDRFSNMNIITKGNVYFTRDILWGGSDITKRISDVMGVNMEEAEALKLKPGEKREEVVNAITPFLERLTSQIRMSFDYFESQFGKNVERLYVSGGSSYLFNVVDFFKDDLGVDAIMWNPFEGIRISETVAGNEIEKMPAIFAVAVGLALRK